MLIKHKANHLLTLEYREARWLLVLFSVSAALVSALLYKSFSWIGVAALGLTVLVFAWFAMISVNATVTLDKDRDLFACTQKRLWRKAERFECPLHEITDVILESEDDATRLGFVIQGKTLYPSEIFSSSAWRSEERVYRAVRDFLFG
ncbi:hypothetical protein HCH_01989 [Hahella chejuensis KCTC 2396]|uniref:Uncharacterized protein n=1 Tax=Hahella chejuensis (strain KCTC 2396) TaxID=349521 RepID=Q2SKK1_HAHCH|nr:hypothetical protein [Hahella chejuensis]ABC28823.1 hypothetical protein HCH_01989 [Hahella chejuensis KCTC 2396]